MKRICVAKDIDIHYHGGEVKHEHKILFYFDVEDVYTAINAHWLKVQNDHEKMVGYFGNSLQSLINGIIYNCHVGTLDLTIGGIDDKKRFIATGDNRMGKKAYTYFLPKQRVVWLDAEEKLPGYRLYKDAEEALDDIPVDPVTHLRYLRTLRDEWHVEEPAIARVAMSGILNSQTVIIDGEEWTLKDLSHGFERLDKDGWWRPCGVRSLSASEKYTAYDYDTHLKALQSWD